MAKRETKSPAKKQSAATKTKKAENAVSKTSKPDLPAVRPVAAPPKKVRKSTTKAVTAANFPIVGIGASAGGLEAFQQFFNYMPPDTGMAFVLIQHLDPTRKSIMAELIRRYTEMNVEEVTDGVTVERHTVFVIPPNSYMAILNGKLHLLQPPAPAGHRMPIDFFSGLLQRIRRNGQSA